MTVLSEKDAKKLAARYLDSEHIRNPHEETTKADELYQFWKWNPPGFAEGHPADWSGWEELRWIDPQAGNEGIYKLSVDMPRYFVERSETDRDYWDALCKICADGLGQSSSSARCAVTDNLHLCGWLVGFLNGDRVAPKKPPGNPAGKYYTRNYLIYSAVQTLWNGGKGPMSQTAAFEWVGEQIKSSKDNVASIYRKACLPDTKVEG